MTFIKTLEHFLNTNLVLMNEAVSIVLCWSKENGQKTILRLAITNDNPKDDTNNVKTSNSN